MSMIQPKRDTKVINVGEPGADIPGFHSDSIQNAIDLLKNCGGTVRLCNGKFKIRRPVRLYDHISLVGSGATVLEKVEGVQTNFIVDADYGELKVEVRDPGGFSTGMGIKVFDNVRQWGFGVSTAVITAIEGKTLYFDNYLTADYVADQNGIVSNACSIIEGVGVRNVSISNLIIEGNKHNNYSIDGCRGAGVYLHKSEDCRLENVKVINFNGDGISWQITDRITIVDCEVAFCTGSGLHPGAGSEKTVVDNCNCHNNDASGMFICWRVKKGLFSNNKFHRNAEHGISIGHKDTDNRFESNHFFRNRQSGIYVRLEAESNGAHRNTYVNNIIEDNGNENDGCGMYINGVTNDSVIENNVIRDNGQGLQKIGFFLGDGVSINLGNNKLSGHSLNDVMEQS